MSDGFAAPTTSATLDVARHLREVPSVATVRGMFFSDLASVARARGRTLALPRAYVPFRTYPMREFMELQVRAAEQAFPHVTLREGLRRIGQLAYPTMRESMVGRVLFALAADDPATIYGLAPRAYQIVSTHGGVRTIEIGSDHAHFEFFDLYNFVDCYHVGIAEGVLTACGRNGRVEVKVHALAHAELRVRWS